MKVFAVYDSKAEAFLQPFYAPTVGIAVRQFEAAANETEHNFWRFGGDFTLFHIADWDEKTGRFQGAEVQANLGKALDFQRGSE